ncbi:hypothetical protein AC1031_019730 [Aphanomyces cochlioides]|nr:hypothetical protein AC1031_019730 [Aphanomyces cochlioides]
MITGGAGFMGSNFVHYMLQHHENYKIIVYDKLTYSGNLDNLAATWNNSRFQFIKGDICDSASVDSAIVTHNIDTIVNFAAETHVDRSILNPQGFIETNVGGTCALLECVRRHNLRFHQISTDEVYGQMVGSQTSRETDKLDPRSPYAASKASADLIVLSYFTTYGSQVTITRGSNNVGPFQYPEKVVSLFTTNAIDNLPLPLYGNGLQRREYQYVEDHCRAVDLVLHQGVFGEIYNVGTGESITNMEMTEIILSTLAKPRTLIRHVQDRPGHDLCYNLNSDKIRALGWSPRYSSTQAVKKTVQWFIDHQIWWRKAKAGDFEEFYRMHYQDQLQQEHERPKDA